MARNGYITGTFFFDGKKYYVYGTTKEEVALKKAEKIKELESGILDSNITVKQWADTWMETYIIPKGIQKASMRMYEDNLKNAIFPRIGNIRLRNVNPTQLQQLLNTRAGMSFGHASKLRIVIKAMFRQAYINRIIPYDPSADLRMPKTTKGQHRSLTEKEREAILSFCEQDTNSALWIMSMLYCGLRPGETAALRWQDVDLQNNTLHIRNAKESHGTAIKAPKTNAGIRDIPIPQCYAKRLQSALKSQGYVFTQNDGVSPLTDSSMKRKWESVKKYMDIYLGAKVEKIKPPGKRKSVSIITEHALAYDIDLYDLRHTYCTDLQKKGVPINIAKVLMGHSDITVTANIYTHADTETTEMARKLIDG